MLSRLNLLFTCLCAVITGHMNARLLHLFSIDGWLFPLSTYPNEGMNATLTALSPIFLFSLLQADDIERASLTYSNYFILRLKRKYRFWLLPFWWRGFLSVGVFTIGYNLVLIYNHLSPSLLLSLLLLVVYSSSNLAVILFGNRVGRLIALTFLLPFTLFVPFTFVTLSLSCLLCYSAIIVASEWRIKQ